MRRIPLVIIVLILLAAMVSPALAHGSDVAADFNNDGFADLAVGVPGENDSAGAVNVLYGTGGGLSGAGGQVFFQVGGNSESGDQFGYALAAGDFNNDNFADLAVGAPFEAIGRAGRAGAVSVLYGSAGGLTTASGRLFTQIGGPWRRTTSSVMRWPPGTSTMTASPIWPRVRPVRLWVAS